MRGRFAPNFGKYTALPNCAVKPRASALAAHFPFGAKLNSMARQAAIRRPAGSWPRTASGLRSPMATGLTAFSEAQIKRVRRMVRAIRRGGRPPRSPCAVSCHRRVGCRLGAVLHRFRRENLGPSSVSSQSRTHTEAPVTAGQPQRKETQDWRKSTNRLVRAHLKVARQPYKSGGLRPESRRDRRCNPFGLFGHGTEDFRVGVAAVEGRAQGR